MSKPFIVFAGYPPLLIVYNRKNDHLGDFEIERVGRRERLVFSPCSDTYFTHDCLERIARNLKEAEAHISRIKSKGSNKHG